MTVKSRDLRDGQTSRLPGHKIVSIILAVAVWVIGVVLTTKAIPVDKELGTAGSVGIALGVQLLLTLAQSNLRIFGFSFDRWPFAIMVLIDVAFNWAGLLSAYIAGVSNLSDAGLYALHAFSTGTGLWQTLVTLLIGALIAFAPEQMVKDALKM